MKKIILDLVALEPLIITDGSAEGMAHSCLDYIPGSMLLGAFAEAWIRRNRGLNPDETAEFQDLFLAGKVSWGNAYPLCAGRPCVPVPLCYMREKSLGGLPLPDAEASSGQYAVFNVLALADDETLADWCLKHKRSFGAAPPKFKKLQAAFMQPGSLRQPLIHKVWNTRVALGQSRHALEGRLFGFAAIGSGCEFQAEIYCHDEAAEAAALKLLQDLKSVRVGHARSAGYGRVCLTARAEIASAKLETEAEHLDLYLLSDYLPEPAWENPLENFKRKIAAFFELEIKFPRLNVAYRRIESFNGHWRKWRDTRMALAQGSVIRIQAAEKIWLEPEFALGGDQQEGYGRIIVNPRFLAEVDPEIRKMALTLARPESKVAMPAGLSFKILCERALARLAFRQAEAWLGDERWQKFVQSASKHDRPTASQRARLNGITEEAFKSLLDKSAGSQWKTVACVNPFGTGKDYLSAIIPKILARDEFLREFPLASNLARQSGLDQAQLAKAAHAIFKCELVKAWGRGARTRQNDGGEE